MCDRAKTKAFAGAEAVREGNFRIVILAPEFAEWQDGTVRVMQRTPTLIQTGPGAYRMELCRWGWDRAGSKEPQLHSRIETTQGRPRGPAERACLFPVSGWHEGKWLFTPRLGRGSLLWLAGLCRETRGEGIPLTRTVVPITCAPPQKLGLVAERTPFPLMTSQAMGFLGGGGIGDPDLEAVVVEPGEGQQTFFELG